VLGVVAAVGCWPISDFNCWSNVFEMAVMTQSGSVYLASGARWDLVKIKFDAWLNLGR
jgi:hypothetical protein